MKQLTRSLPVCRARLSCPSLTLLQNRCASTTTSSQYSGYETTFTPPPSAYGWRYHIDNTIQFILWASFGSAAIHLLNIKQKYSDKERRLSTKIAVLKDIIRRVHEGEDVDIARELKVGRSEEEKEWQEVMDSFREQAGIEIKRLESDTRSFSDAISALERPTSEARLVPLDGRLGGSQSATSKGGWFWRQ